MGVPIARRLFDALSRSDIDAITAVLAPDVVAGLAPKDAIETDPRVLSHGADAVAQCLCADLARRVVHAVGVDGLHVLIEGTVEQTNGAATHSFLTRLWINVDGSVSRILDFVGRPAAPTGEVATSNAVNRPFTAQDARRVVDEYFHALEVGRFEDAAAWFSADVVYVHPPYRHTGIVDPQRVTFTGRDELLAAFYRRGIQSFRHRIDAFAMVGDRCLFAGRVVDLPNGAVGTYASSAQFVDGGIARYLSFYAEPAPFE